MRVFRGLCSVTMKVTILLPTGDFKSVQPFVCFTGIFQLKSIGVMAIFRHFDNERSSNFVFIIKAIFIIFRGRLKKTHMTNSEDRLTGDYLYHPRFS